MCSSRLLFLLEKLEKNKKINYKIIFLESSRNDGRSEDQMN